MEESCGAAVRKETQLKDKMKIFFLLVSDWTQQGQNIQKRVCVCLELMFGFWVSVRTVSTIQDILHSWVIICKEITLWETKCYIRIVFIYNNFICLACYREETPQKTNMNEKMHKTCL